MLNSWFNMWAFHFQRIFVVAQWSSCVQLFATLWTAAHQASLSLTISRSLPKFMSIALVMPSSHLILWCPLLLLPSIFPSLRDFSNESAVYCRWPKYWSFSFSISSSNEYSGLISLKTDWFDLPAVQPLWPSNPTSGHIPLENCNSKRHMYPNVHCSTIYNREDMEAT